jgi:hypothetical protein
MRLPTPQAGDLVEIGLGGEVWEFDPINMAGFVAFMTFPPCSEPIHCRVRTTCYSPKIFAEAYERSYFIVGLDFIRHLTVRRGRKRA